MPYPERVETERLVLRRWEPGDRAAFEAIWADPDVWAALRPGERFDPAVGPERFEHHLAHWREHGFGLWAAEERATGAVAGWVGASHPTFVPELAGEVEIGWSLRRPSWGRGLATEGAAAAARAALAHLAPERIIALIAPANSRSAAVAERIGMRRAGRARHGHFGLELSVYALSAAEAAARAGGPASG